MLKKLNNCLKNLNARSQDVRESILVIRSQREIKIFRLPGIKNMEERIR